MTCKATISGLFFCHIGELDVSKRSKYEEERNEDEFDAIDANCMDTLGQK